MKLGASRHLQRRPRVMRQDEDRCVIRRLVTPPALPAIIRPGPPNRTEHITPKDVGANPGKTFLGNSVIYSRLAIIASRLSIVVAMHLSPYACAKEPLHQLSAAHAERILHILIRPSAVTVNRDREVLYLKFRQDFPP